MLAQRALRGASASDFGVSLEAHRSRNKTCDDVIQRVAAGTRLRNVRERLRSSIGSAAFAALEKPSGLWGPIFTLKAAIAAPLALSALLGVMIVARPSEPAATEPPKMPAVALSPLPRITPSSAPPAQTTAPPPAIAPAPPPKPAAPALAL